VASVPEQLIAQVAADTALVGVTVDVGRRATSKFAAPPRVVAIPLGAPVLRQPDRPGDAGYSDVGRILLVREFRILWECHGAPASAESPVDFTAAENLYLNVLRACRNVMHNSVEFGEEDWRDQQEGEDGFERFGNLISFVSTVYLPVYEARGPIVPLTATPPIVTTVTELDQSQTINQG
jgi:hypothetical protein